VRNPLEDALTVLTRHGLGGALQIVAADGARKIAEAAAIVDKRGIGDRALAALARVWMGCVVHMPGGDHRMVKSSCEKSSLYFLGVAICLALNLAGCSPTDPRLADCYAVRMAILSSDMQRVRAQLESVHRVDVTCRKTDEAPTLLSYAMNIRSAEIAQLLLDKGADPDLADDGITPLMYASIHGYSDLAALLLEHGASINLVEDQYGMTALA
jgi:hypothetical protein